MSVNKNTLAWRLRQARMDAELTQVELAKAVGTSQDIISKIERGEILNPKSIERLAKALDTSPAWLRFGVKELDLLDPESIHFALAYQALPQDKKDLVNSVLKTLKDK